MVIKAAVVLAGRPRKGAGAMQQELATRYPLVLVPGMLGFVRVVLYPYWFGIVPALRQGGAQVFPVQVSPLHSSEVRGEQLLAIIEDIFKRWCTSFSLISTFGVCAKSKTRRFGLS